MRMLDCIVVRNPPTKICTITDTLASICDYQCVLISCQMVHTRSAILLIFRAASSVLNADENPSVIASWESYSNQPTSLAPNLECCFPSRYQRVYRPNIMSLGVVVALVVQRVSSSVMLKSLNWASFPDFRHSCTSGLVPSSLNHYSPSLHLTLPLPPSPSPSLRLSLPPPLPSSPLLLPILTYSPSA